MKVPPVCKYRIRGSELVSVDEIWLPNVSETSAIDREKARETQDSDEHNRNYFQSDDDMNCYDTEWHEGGYNDLMMNTIVGN